MQNTLKENRLAINATQLEVANFIGCSKSYYCNLEKGIRNPSLEVAMILAKYFNTTVEELFKLPSENSSSEKQ